MKFRHDDFGATPRIASDIFLMAEGGIVHWVGDDTSPSPVPDAMFRVAGYGVERWPDGEAFLAGADRNAPACVFIDASLSGASGLPLAATVGAVAALTFPVIVITGAGDMAAAVRAMAAGAADILEQPFDFADLRQSITAALERIAEGKADRERSRAARIQLSSLTKRERDVLERLAGGYPNYVIAAEFGVERQTVEAWRDEIVATLGLEDFASALRIAFAAGRRF